MLNPFVARYSRILPLLLSFVLLTPSSVPAKGGDADKEAQKKERDGKSAKIKAGMKAAKATKTAKPAKNSRTVTREAVRLPRNVLPDTYRIFIEPDLENGQFSGEETIFLEVGSSTKDIVLNSVGLEIGEVEVAQNNDEGHGKWIAPERTIEDKEKQQVTFRFQQSLKPGKHELRIKFGGKLNDKLAGFYLSGYTDDKGEKHKIACTQMEPTDARKVFPCFDEPDMKASFKVTLAVDAGLTAISNAPIEFDKTDGRSGKRQISFAETPKMSTYLVVLVVGPFESTEPVKVNNVDIRVWATPGHKDQCAFASAAAQKMLPYFESYFGVKYPLNKLDLIAIPDFSAGAMENLGAVTFRETRLLVDEKTASTVAKQDVAAVIAHEMAHMWFGDLVTMKWWDDLWLNEAFATWMSVKAMEAYKPDWHPWDLFVRDRAPALASDSLVSTHPIYTEVSDPSEAEEMFDEITYDKGASVLRMLERFLGEETYMKGIQKYIRDHQFGNAETSELWGALEDVSGKPVAAIMREWVYSPGYPLLTVANKETRKGTGGALTLTQDYFSISPVTLSDSKSSKANANKSRKLALWQVPVTSRVLKDDLSASREKSNYVRMLLTDKKGDLTNIPAGGPVVVNGLADGYFRVQYPSGMLDELGKKVQSSMTAAERYQFLNDAWSFVESGSMPVSQYMNLTAYYRDETDPNVVELLVSQVSTLDWFVKPESRANFAAFVRDRFGPLARKLGWEPKEDESELTQILRSHVLSAIGTYGQDRGTIAEARKFWDIYQEQPGEINPNLYEAIVAIMAYNGDKGVYDDMEQLFKTASTPEAKLRNLYGLAHFREPDLQKRTLEMSMTDEVKTQDAPHVVLHLLRTTAGRDLGWDFVKSHWQAMEARYPVHLFPRIVNGTTSFVSQAQSADLERFLADHPIKSGRRVAGKAIERVRSNVKINERSGESLDSWLKEFRTRENASNLDAALPGN
jgi:puromycin-sensitive aminopeptidase